MPFITVTITRKMKAEPVREKQWNSDYGQKEKHIKTRTKEENVSIL